MRDMLDLVKGARIEQQKPERTAEPLVQPFGAEHSPMAEFVLPGIQEIEQHAVQHEYRYRPWRAANQPQDGAGCANRTNMRKRLNGALQIRWDAKTSQGRAIDHLPPHEYFLHLPLPHRITVS